MGRRRGIQYRPGSFWRTDERSGFATRAEDTRKEWTGAIVGTRFWEPRQPQDFVKGVLDLQTVPDPRSENPPLWQGPISAQLSAAAAIGTTTLLLESTYGFTEGGNVGVMLDSGVMFNTTIDSVIAGGITIAAGIPYTAASGNIVTAYEAPGP